MCPPPAVWSRPRVISGGLEPLLIDGRLARRLVSSHPPNRSALNHLAGIFERQSATFCLCLDRFPNRRQQRNRKSTNGALFTAIWPYLRWSIAVAFTVLAIELIYYLAPNVKQR